MHLKPKIMIKPPVGWFKLFCYNLSNSLKIPFVIAICLNLIILSLFYARMD